MYCCRARYSMHLDFRSHCHSPAGRAAAAPAKPIETIQPTVNPSKSQPKQRPAESRRIHQGEHHDSIDTHPGR